MKISISYPPIESPKGTPTIGQNRQFQWFSRPTYIYPVIPAYAASLLKQNGYEVFWDDAIAQQLAQEQWKERIIQEQPDIIAIETKTPVVQHHWKIIDDLILESLKIHPVKSSLCEVTKGEFNGIKNLNPPAGGWEPKILLMGDHATALPKESLEKSKVDYVYAGGDYDFALLSLARHLDKNQPLGGGFWYRNKVGGIENTGPADYSSNKLDSLPLIDRELTRWKDYAYENGNFKYHPGAYLMSGRDCWWGKCSFCSWAAMFPGDKFRVMSPSKALDEVGNLVRLGAREIMEDTGTLPTGEWLEEFCLGMIKREYSEKVKLGCNMRINAIQDPAVWQLMKKAGFRFVLFGLESANQATLDRINKGLRVSEIEPSLKMCKAAGLEPHVTVMIGYPWESKSQAQNTIRLAKRLFKAGIIDTLQSTVVVPYPGTPLFRYCQDNELLLSNHYAAFDQREPIIESPLNSREIKQLVSGVYLSAVSPKFILNKIVSIRSFDDLNYFLRSVWKLLGHLKDFSD